MHFRILFVLLALASVAAKPVPSTMVKTRRCQAEMGHNQRQMLAASIMVPPIQAAWAS